MSSDIHTFKKDIFPSSFFLLIACLLSILIFIRAAYRHLWFDELFTWHIASLPFARIWGALSSGADNTPPLIFWLTSLSHSVFGPQSELTTRLPAIISFLVCCLLLYAILRLRYPSQTAYVALLFFILTRAPLYAAEARPYSLLLATSCLAIYSWLKIAQGSPHRLPALIGLCLGLVMTIYGHFYGALLFVPLAVAELHRSLNRHAVDWPVWFVFVGAALSLSGLWPIIQASAGFSASFWSPPTFYIIVRSIAALTLNPILVSLAVWLILWMLLRNTKEPPHFSLSRLFTSRLAPHERTLALGLTLLFIIGLFPALLITNAYNARYFIPAWIGLTMLAAGPLHHLLSMTERISRSIVLLLVILSLGWMSFLTVKEITPNHKLRVDLITMQDTPSEHLFVPNALRFLAVYHYAADNMKKRLVYLHDLEQERNRTGNDTASRSLKALASQTPLPVFPLEEFLSRESTFLMYGSNKWIKPFLNAAGFELFPVKSNAKAEMMTVVTSKELQ